MYQQSLTITATNWIHLALYPTEVVLKTHYLVFHASTGMGMRLVDAAPVTTQPKKAGDYTLFNRL